jgi:ribosomal protein S18 acetylase RimI-like enzyme
MLIRPKCDADLAGCVQLVRAVHAADGYPRYFPGDPEGFISPPGETAGWVAVRGAALVGHVALHSAAGDAADGDGDPLLGAAQRGTGLPASQLSVVARLLVAPAARRQGLGRALLTHAVTEARAAGQRAVLDVTCDAAPAIALYEALGWTRLERITLSLASGNALDLWVYLSPEDDGAAVGHN